MVIEVNNVCVWLNVHRHCWCCGRLYSVLCVGDRSCRGAMEQAQIKQRRDQHGRARRIRSRGPTSQPTTVVTCRRAIVLAFGPLGDRLACWPHLFLSMGFYFYCYCFLLPPNSPCCASAVVALTDGQLRDSAAKTLRLKNILFLWILS